MYQSVSQYCAVISLLIFSSVSFAQSSYQVELSTEYWKLKETVGDVEANGLSVATEIFFDKVETGSHPYAEAAFLEHVSSLAVAYVDAEVTTSSLGLDYSNILLLANYVVPDSLFILQALYIGSDGDYKNGTSGTSESDGFGFGAGMYIDDRSLILLSYTQYDMATELILASTSNTKSTEMGVEYKRVHALEEGRAYGFATSLLSSEFESNAISETNTIIDFAVDYYLNQSISVGAKIEINTGDDTSNEGSIIGINANLYLTPVFSVHAELNQFSADNVDGDDTDEFFLGATARF